MPRAHNDAHAAGLDRLKEAEHSTNAGRLQRHQLRTKVPATGHLIDFDPIQPVLA